MLRPIEQVTDLLNDRTFAEKSLTQVSKGSKGSFTYVPWNETTRILDQIFGPMGWDSRLTDRQVTESGGAFIYHVGLELTVRAAAPDGSIITATRAGVGVGIAAPNRDGYLAPDAHDTAAKAARSDAISTAAKTLGNAFGLFLYDRGDPAREGTANVSGQSNSTSQQAQSTSGTSGSVKRNSWGGIGKCSVKQTDTLLKAGYSEKQIDGMTKEQASSCIGALIAREELPIKPENPPTKKPVAPKETAANAASAGDIPF